MTKDFDPGALVTDPNAGIFGLPYGPDESAVVLVPVPWEATVTFGTGTKNAPSLIKEMSNQIDLFDPYFPKAYERGIYLDEPVCSAFDADDARHMYNLALTAGLNADEARRMQELGVISKVNDACAKLNVDVYSHAAYWRELGKIVGIVGGDHSVPLGAIKAAGTFCPKFDVLHIDAHADLRPAYMGFTYSHASIMHNVLKIPQVNRIVQVGVRDYCEDEFKLMGSERVCTFLDKHIQENKMRCLPWSGMVDDILSALGESVYVSFDIDGLDPSLCPHTGTPVPGGLSFDEAAYLLYKLVWTGKNIVGFDLVEVNGNRQWDAIVGSRMLYKLCCAAIAARGGR